MVYFDAKKKLQRVIPILSCSTAQNKVKSKTIRKRIWHGGLVNCARIRKQYAVLEACVTFGNLQAAEKLWQLFNA